MAKRKLPSNFGPKDLTKLPPGLRAYWEKKRAGEKGDKKSKDNTEEKAKPVQKTTKSAKKSQKTSVRGKKAPKSTTPRATKRRVKRPVTKKAKKTNTTKREGVATMKTGRSLLKARGTAKK